MALTLTHQEALRFVAFITVTPTGCWEWTGARTTGNGHPLDRGGYPKFTLRGQQVLAHRVMFAAVAGQQAQTVDHRCRNRACVRPSHLADVMMQENILRGTSPAALNARKIVCQRGHPLDGVQAKGRVCRTCRKADYKRYRARQRANTGAAR